MRGEHTFKILSELEKKEKEALDFLGEAFTTHVVQDCETSSNKSVSKRANDVTVLAQKKPREARRQVLRRFYAMVQYLEQDGMVRKTTIETKIFVGITKKGKAKLEILESMFSRQLPSASYNNEEDKKVGEGAVTIVTFDIPERDRWKRDWMRNALREMDFTIVHKSVWMGKDGVFKSFLHDMRDLDLADYVEIFQISKAGTLRKLL